MRTEDIGQLAKLERLAAQLAKGLKKPQLILLDGPLGAGKTQMVRFMGEALGVPKREICSPGFGFINIYSSPKGPVCHADLFRIKEGEDLDSTGFWDLFCEPGFVFIEWAQMAEGKLPPLWGKLQLIFRFSEEGRRLLSISSITSSLSKP